MSSASKLKKTQEKKLLEFFFGNLNNYDGLLFLKKLTMKIEEMALITHENTVYSFTRENSTVKLTSTISLLSKN